MFIGGACQAELLETDDDSLKRIAVDELADLLAIRGEPMLAQVHRWGESMPQYHVGHLDRLERIAQRVALHRGLTLAGNAYEGVGVPQCVESGERAAVEVLEQLQTRPKPRAADRS